MSKKIIITSVVAVILVGILSFGLSYLFLYEKNDDTLVCFMNKAKVNLNGEYALYDIENDKILENVQFTCSGEGKVADKSVTGSQIGKINLVSKTIAITNFEAPTFSFFENGNTMQIWITNFTVDENNDGNITSGIDDYSFNIYVDKKDSSKHYIKVSEYEKEKEGVGSYKDKYVIIKAKDTKEVKDIMDSMKK